MAEEKWNGEERRQGASFQPPFCMEHGELRQLLGKLIAYHETTCADIEAARKDIKEATDKITKITDRVKDGSIQNTIGKMTMWALTIVGGVVLVEWVKGIIWKVTFK